MLKHSKIVFTGMSGAQMFQGIPTSKALGASCAYSCRVAQQATSKDKERDVKTGKGNFLYTCSVNYRYGAKDSSKGNMFGFASVIEAIIRKDICNQKSDGTNDCDSIEI